MNDELATATLRPSSNITAMLSAVRSWMSNCAVMLPRSTLTASSTSAPDARDLRSVRIGVAVALPFPPNETY